MEISELVHETDVEMSIDSTNYSSTEELDSGVQYHQCYSCGNAFTTTRVLSRNPEKVFCDDCAQMPEYMSHSSLDLLSSCDESGPLRQRRLVRLQHSQSEESLKSYQEAVKSKEMKKTVRSVLSMCSECRIEMESADRLGSVDHEVAQLPRNDESLGSLCSTCKAQQARHHYLNTNSVFVDSGKQEGKRKRKRKREKQKVSRTLKGRRGSGDTLDNCLDDDSELLLLTTPPSSLSKKSRLRPKFNDDSGIKLMPEGQYSEQCSETLLDRHDLQMENNEEECKSTSPEDAHFTYISFLPTRECPTP